MKTPVLLLALPSICGLLLLVRTSDATVQTPGCGNEEYLLFQNACRTADDFLLNATADHKHGADSSVVCRGLFAMWSCVATHVPRCFVDFTHHYNSYLHSPYNCHQKADVQLIARLQNLTKQSAQEQGIEDVATDVDIATLTPTPPGPSPFEEPLPEDEEGGSKASGDGENGEADGPADVIVDQERGTGEADRHSSNGCPHAVRSSPVLSVFLILWSLAARMTSRGPLTSLVLA